MNGDQQKVTFSSPVKAVNNIEDWLCELLKKMQVRFYYYIYIYDT